MIKSHVITLSLCAILAGCAIRPELPSAKQDFSANVDEIKVSSQWWKEFNDEKLNNLIQKAFKNNLDLKITYINLQKAAASLGAQKADWLPSLSANAGATRANSSGEANPSSGFNLRAGLSYELDIWGKVRDSVDMAKANLMASRYDYDAARISLAASVAKGYFNLANLLAQQAVYKESLKNYEATRDLYAHKLALGAINKSEYLQSQASVQNAEINLDNLDISIRSAKAALAILTGASNDEIIHDVADIGKSDEVAIDAGINSQLLEHRPDVAAAWQRVVSANAALGVAKKAWLPSLSLSASFGYNSGAFDTLINPANSAWSLGGNLAQMIFDAGKINANIDIAKLSEDAAFINYESTVRTAISEAVTAINAASISLSAKQKNAELLKTQEEIYEIMQIQYDNGAAEYISLLDAQRSLLNARLEFAKSEFTQKSAVVDLFKSLGGGWSKEQLQANN